MNKRELIKHHLSQLSVRELFSYRLLLCSGEPNENIELDVIDLFKYPARLQTSYFDNWQKDVLKALFRSFEEEFQTSSQMDIKIEKLLSKQTFSEKDDRTLLLFENFLVSLKSTNVVSIHSSLHDKLDKLSF
jgi:hypothetical protein